MSYRNSLTTKKLIDTKAIGINPYIDTFQGPNLYYCHLGPKLLIPKAGKLADTRNLDSDLYEEQTIETYYDIAPGEFILAQTFETFMTDTKHALRLFNSSSLARLGISQCALGMINPGCGQKSPLRLTLELSNNGPYTVRLYTTRFNDKSDHVTEWGTEVLKVAVCDYEATDIAYEDWSGALYGSDGEVTGSKIDRRFK